MLPSKTPRNLYIMKRKKILELVMLLLAMHAAWSCGEQTQAKHTSYAFDYTEIYLPEHGSEEYDSLSLHNLDKEWGIWGHNLGQVLPEYPSQAVYAKQNGMPYREQFCFSSEELYEYIVEFIDSDYGVLSSSRFAILPNDNQITCLCPKCKAAGNSSDDASPAVMQMIRRLAKHFPKHMFFTSHYGCVKSMPEEPMPKNVGVLVSAIDFPLSVTETDKEKEFATLLADWSQKTHNVYVWDYINNFDDYFTPFPVFSVMERRFKLYKEVGANGIFLNGSGEDYSSLSRLKLLVLSSMLENPDTDWRKELKQKAMELYPTTGELIYDFMMAQENYVQKLQKELPLYDGITTALKTYLPREDFEEFHDALFAQCQDAAPEEQAEMEKLCKAMELTRLELMRKDGQLEDYESRLETLLTLDSNDDIHVYSESSWSLASYAKDYRLLAERNAQSSGNRLKGVKLQALSTLDPEYDDLSILTDGVLGMPTNYHNGIVINSPELKWSIGVPAMPGLKTLRVWLVTNPAFRMGLPKRINLLSGGNVLNTIEPKLSGGKVGHTFVDISVPPAGGMLTLEFARNKEVPSMGIEEIEGF